MDNNLKITVSKAELIETLKSNRQKHEKDYNNAKIGFRKMLRVELAKKLASLDANKKVELSFKNHKPESHLGDYDEVLDMLNMALGENIEINHRQYKQWVKNDWEWKRYWDTSNSAYVVSGMAA